MPSPFPGMDPWLEDPDVWPDFHGGLIYAFRAALSAALPPGYSAKVDRSPDFAVTGPTVASGPLRGSVATLEPTTYATFPSAKRHGNRFIRIVDRKDRHVVTVLELLSPSNKASGEDRTFYLNKRKEYLAASTNLVELDLLRDGDRLPMGRPKPRPADYYIVVSRASEFPRVGIWTFNVRDHLPTIPIPLKPGVADVSLDLRPCLDRTYDEAQFENELDYSRPPVPPLRSEDVAWAEEICRKHSKRSRK